MARCLRRRARLGGHSSHRSLFQEELSCVGFICRATDTKLNLGRHPKPAIYGHLKTGH